MPQSAFATTIGRNAAGAAAPSLVGPIGVLAVTEGGVSSALNVTAAAVIKASPGRLCKIVVVAPGSAGTLVVNDLATTTGSAAGNVIFSIGFAALSVGQVIVLDWPCVTGIAVTTVPSAGSPILSLSFV